MRVVLRQCERPITVDAGLTSCGSCVRGQCAAALACQVPEPGALSRRRLSPRQRNRLIVAALAAGGWVACIGVEVIHRMF